MKINKIMLGLSAAALVAMPAVAQVAMVPTAAPLDGEESEMAAGGTGLILGIIGAAAVIGGIVVIADDDNSDAPVSP